MTLSAITILILCTCCCTTQLQVNSSTNESGLFELLQRAIHNSYTKHGISHQQHQQQQEYTPDYKESASTDVKNLQEFDDDNLLNSNETSMLPHDIIHSIYESVVFQKIPMDYHSGEVVNNTSTTYQYTPTTKPKKNTRRRLINGKRGRKLTSKSTVFDVITTSQVMTGATPHQGYSRIARQTDQEIDETKSPRLDSHMQKQIVNNQSDVFMNKIGPKSSVATTTMSPGQTITQNSSKNKQSTQFTTQNSSENEQSTQFSTLNSTKNEQSTQFTTQNSSENEQSTQFSTLNSTKNEQTIQFTTQNSSENEQSTQFTTQNSSESEQNTQFSTLNSTKNEQNTQFSTLNSTKNEQSTQFKTQDSSENEQTTQFSTLNSTKNEQTIQFTTQNSSENEQSTQFTTQNSSESEQNTQFSTLNSTKNEQNTQFSTLNSTKNEQSTQFKTQDSSKNEPTTQLYTQNSSTKEQTTQFYTQNSSKNEQSTYSDLNSTTSLSSLTNPSTTNTNAPISKTPSNLSISSTTVTKVMPYYSTVTVLFTSAETVPATSTKTVPNSTTTSTEQVLSSSAITVPNTSSTTPRTSTVASSTNTATITSVENASRVSRSSDNSTDITTKAECIQSIVEQIYAVSSATSISFNFTTSRPSSVDDWFASVNHLKPTCDKLNNSCHIDKLNPCTEYEIQVEITTCENQSSVNKTIHTTLDIAPQVELFQVESLLHSKMNVTWKLPIENSCDANITYTLSWHEIDGNAELNQINTNKQSWLIPCEKFHQKYNICIISNLYDDQSQLIYQTQQQCIISDYSSPGPPSEPIIVNSTILQDEIIISYSFQSPNGYIDYMEYNLTEPDSQLEINWIRNDSATDIISIPILESCTNYTIQLKAINVDFDGTSLLSNTTRFHFTSNAKKLAPPILSLHSKNSTNLLFNLTDAQYTKCPRDFIINVQSIDNCYSDVINISTNQIHLNLANLKPYTTYEIQSSTKTQAGIGKWNQSTYTTDHSKPPKPAFTLPICDKQSCQLNLLIPSHLTGPTSYNVYTNDKNEYLFQTQLYKTSPNDMCIKKENVKASVYIPGLKPYTNYTIKIEVIVERFFNNKFIPVQTKPAEPGYPEKLRVYCNYSNTEGLLDWEKPQQVNGILQEFALTYIGVRDDRTPHFESKRILAHESLLYAEIVPLWPDYNYTFKIAAKTQNVPNAGPQKEITCFKPASLPPGMIAEKFKPSNIVANKATIADILISRDLFTDFNGKIVNYSIILYQDSNLYFTDTKFWSDTANTDKILPYRTTPNNWNPFENEDNSDMCCEKNNTFAHCQIGCNLNCSHVIGPCNGPLRSNTKYQIIIKAYTTAGFTQTEAITFQTVKISVPSDSSQTNGLAVALAVTTPILILLICIILVITYRREQVNKLLYRIRQHRRISSVFTTQSTEQIVIENQLSTRPVLLESFIKHYNLMNKDSGLKFSQEFEEIKAISPTFPKTTAQLSENKPKNRWINILPFDHSRVKLLPISDDITTDYINACYIPGFNSQREYIATQGPLPGTKDDFWRMVWEQSCQMIVMVTQCVERGKRKCEVYWPEDREVHYYGDLSIQLRSESILSNFTIRIFDLHLGTKSLEVKQMHFTKWPDFGCPENTSLLINFVQAVREHTPHGFIGPFVIHCSAGVGRTGTYISVDRLMQHIRQHNYVDIYGLVLEMRQFRVNMVQTEDQYIYIHSCVRDILKGQSVPESEPLYANIALNAKGHTNDSQL